MFTAFAKSSPVDLIKRQTSDECSSSCNSAFSPEAWACDSLHHASRRRRCDRSRTEALTECQRQCEINCSSEDPAEPTQEPVDDTNTTVSQVVSGCDYVSYDLTCTSPANVTSGTITYGRWNDTICAPATDEYPSVEYKNETYPLPDAYLGSSQTTLDATQGLDSILSQDPIPGIIKQIQIEYVCV